MYIKLPQPIGGMEQLIPQIIHLFPGYDLNVPFLNRKRLMITKSDDKAAVVLIMREKGHSIEVKAEPNTKNPGLMMVLVFGVLCSPIGILIALGILYGTGGEERNKRKLEAYELLKTEFED